MLSFLQTTACHSLQASHEVEIAAGTQSVLFSKTLSTLLRTTLQGDGQLGSWFTWLTLMLLLVTASFWVTRLNKVGTSCGTAFAVLDCQ